jgi:HEAT repeat protein
MEFELIVNGLMNTNSSVRRKTLLQIEKLGNREALPYILRVLESDDDVVLRAEAARILGVFGDNSVIDRLIDSMLNDREEVSYWASESLIRFDKKEVVEKLSMILFDNTKTVEENNFFWLLQVFRKVGIESLELLLKLLDTPYWLRRKLVAETIQMIGAECESRLLGSINHPSADVRYWICRILGNIGGHDSVEKLKEMLNDESEDVRYAAVRALGDIGSVRAIELLKNSISSGESDIKVKSIETL